MNAPARSLRLATSEMRTTRPAVMAYLNQMGMGPTVDILPQGSKRFDAFDLAWLTARIPSCILRS